MVALVQRKVIGFEMIRRGIARHGYSIHTPAGTRVGEVISGGPAPTLEKNIGLGYVPFKLAEPGNRLAVDSRTTPLRVARGRYRPEGDLLAFLEAL